MQVERLIFLAAGISSRVDRGRARYVQAGPGQNRKSSAGSRRAASTSRRFAAARRSSSQGGRCASVLARDSPPTAPLGLTPVFPPPSLSMASSLLLSTICSHS